MTAIGMPATFTFHTSADCQVLAVDRKRAAATQDLYETLACVVLNVRGRPATAGAKLQGTYVSPKSALYKHVYNQYNSCPGCGRDRAEASCRLPVRQLSVALTPSSM